MLNRWLVVLSFVGFPLVLMCATNPSVKTMPDGTQVYTFHEKPVVCTKRADYAVEHTASGNASIKSIFSAAGNYSSKVINEVVQACPGVSAVQAAQFDACMAYGNGVSSQSEYEQERQAYAQVLQKLLVTADPNCTNTATAPRPNAPAPAPATPVWKSIPAMTKQFQTGDHNCSSHCQGEPTRTNYSFVFKAPNHIKFTNASIQCLTARGICAFSHVYFVRVDPDGSEASASVDVWSKPTIWQITADAQQCTANCP